MDQRTQFLLQVLEKIGSPLTMAVAAVPGNQAGSEAQRVAELLNKSVQLGLALRWRRLPGRWWRVNI